ncbi:spore germination protein [Neobacillus vireti]|uniref:spore germination protein n=1 Tax=Neobacillus vireti TaxID=220686 RepID=UPI002FFF5B29
MFGKQNQVTQVKKVLEENFKDTDDCVFRQVDNGEEEFEMIFLKSVIDNNKVQELLIKPFFEIGKIETYEKYVQSLPVFNPYKDVKETIKSLLHGSIVLLLRDQVHLVELKKSSNNNVLPATVEATILGPQNSLSENIEVNLNLLRNRYHQNTLKYEKLQLIGLRTNLEVAILYDSEVVQSETLQKVKKEINHVDANIIQSTGELSRILMKRKHLLFPRLITTERPDRIAYNLLQGKIVILLEGTPFALLGPASFFDFMSTMEDFYQPFWVSKFLIILRYVGLITSLVLPAAYVGITSYNPEIFRIQFALSIAGSRANVPYPSFIEVLFMLITMEMLIEASIRLPKTIGSTATTVGGLILGQAATEAGMVSNIMIIIVSAVAISNFVIPINEMSLTIRVAKYFLLLLTTLTGIIGLIVGCLGLLFYVISLDSLGQPFLKVVYSEKKRP